jgi:iron complex outermembrane receptor protein
MWQIAQGLGVVFLLVTAAVAQDVKSPATEMPMSGMDLNSSERLGLSDALDLSISIASGKIQSIEEAPGIVSVITDEDIRRLGVQTLADLLRTVPGFDVLVDSTGRNRIAVRGFLSQESYSQGVLILFNGHRLNDHMNGGATIVNMRIPLYNIRRVEIIRGPGSALYGSNAFVAVINLISFAPSNFNGMKVFLNGGSWESREYGFLIGRSGNDWGVLGTTQYSESQGPQVLVPTDAQTLFDRQAGGPPFFFPPISLAPGEADQSFKAEDVSINGFYKGLGWNLRFNNDDAGPFLGRTDILANEGRIYGNQFLLDAGQQFAVGKSSLVTIKFNFSQSRSREKLMLFPPDFLLVAPGYFPQIFPQGVQIDFSNDSRRYGGEGTFSHQFKDNIRLLAGGGFETERPYDLHARGNFSGSLTNLPITPQPQLVPRPTNVIHGERRIGSAFGQADWDVSRSVSVTAGLRYDHYNDFGSRASPRAAVVWRMPEYYYSKFLYGRAFRAPTIDELNFDFAGIVQGNPNLRPAIIHSLEAAFGRKTKSFRGSVNYFANYIRHFIGSLGQVPINPIIFQNFPGINIHGLEVDFRRNFGNTTAVFGNYTYQHPRYLQPRGGRAPEVPEHLANFGATVAIGRYVSVTPFVITRGRRSMEFIGREPAPDTPGYAVTNVNVRIRNFWNTLDLNATANNVFDKKYADPQNSGAGTGYPRPGRQILFGATYRF